VDVLERFQDGSHMGGNHGRAPPALAELLAGDIFGSGEILMNFMIFPPHWISRERKRQLNLLNFSVWSSKIRMSLYVSGSLFKLPTPPTSFA
jgi:hypothetical protein